MGPLSRQQSIQQSTNMICDRSTSLNLEKHTFITINMTTRLRQRLRKQKRQLHCWGRGTNSSCPQSYDTKPSVGIIAHGVGVIPAHSAGASLGRRQRYGLKPLIAMVSKKGDVSAETEAEKGVTKVS